MKPPRFPIPAKLMAGFVANLLLLAVGFAWVFQAQFGSASNELFTSIAEPRVQAVAQRIGEELRQRGWDDWEAVLAAETEAAGVEFALFDGDLRPVAGSVKALPEAIEREVRDGLMRRTPRRRAEGEFPHPPPPRLPFERDGPPFGEMGPPPHHRGRGREREPDAMDPGAASYPKMTARGTNPVAYWVFCLVPVVDSERGYLPLVLAMRSDSLTGNGVFFDPEPWLLAGLGVLLVSGMIWVPVAYNLTSSLRRLRTATGRIAEGDFAVPVPDARRGDELGDLGRSVQAMASRLEAQVSGQKRFLGDIAHELCSPISRLQAVLGILEEGGGTEENRARYLAKVHHEVQQMSALVNELLSFSKASLRREVHVVPVELAPLIREVLDREETGAVPVRLEMAEGLFALADADLLGRALGNLLRNAVRYAGEGGPIEIRAFKNGGEVLIRVCDSGPGVPEEAIDRIFEPFYRPDASRTRESGGTGLGLAIVKTCVEACGGTVSAALRQPRGLEVTIRLTSDH